MCIDITLSSVNLSKNKFKRDILLQFNSTSNFVSLAQMTCWKAEIDCHFPCNWFGTRGKSMIKHVEALRFDSAIWSLHAGIFANQKYLDKIWYHEIFWFYLHRTKITKELDWKQNEVFCIFKTRRDLKNNANMIWLSTKNR